MKLNSVSKTAILLFSYSDKIQRIIKPLSKFKTKNEILWKNIINHKIKVVKKTNLPFFISNENHQVGSSFGQKLTHSIQNIFDEGFDKVIIIGNDCLSLTAKDLKFATDLLQQNNFVLGKDYRNGAYIIGVSKDAFVPNEFTNLDWQSRTIFNDLVSCFGINSIGLLKSKYDFNNVFEFKKCVYNLPFKNAYKLVFTKLLDYTELYFSFLQLKNYRTSSYFHFNKGPPLLDY